MLVCDKDTYVESRCDDRPHVFLNMYFMVDMCALSFAVDQIVVADSADSDSVFVR